MSQTVYSFIDESPSLSDADFFFCIGIISTEDKTNITLRKIIKKARTRTVKKKLKNAPELKFNISDEKTRTYVLKELAKQNIEIIVLVVNKDGQKIADTPKNYALVVGNAVTEVVHHHPVVIVTVDRKYTNTEQAQEFMSECSQIVVQNSPKNKSTSVAFETPTDSKSDSLIQLADFVAGAFNQKYNHNNKQFVEILEKKITTEKVVKWKALKKNS
ncbi:MAG: DUF3800 domain-containing protein [bacterium]|nr:DUF3800 domain-containing protein [bacterium]